MLNEIDGPHLAKCESPRGVLHGKMGEYEKLNLMDREIANRLRLLVERFNGPEMNKNPVNQEKHSHPNGLVEEMDALNRKHSENIEMCMGLLSNLEELI